MQNVIGPDFNQTPNITQGTNNILQRKLPQKFLEEVQKITAEKLPSKEEKNKLTSFLSYCNSVILSNILAFIIAEYYKIPAE